MSCDYVYIILYDFTFFYQTILIKKDNKVNYFSKISVFSIINSNIFVCLSSYSSSTFIILYNEKILGNNLTRGTGNEMVRKDK